ncbi:MAG: 4'-phosphopantetheinyl transferase superfamily protein [Acidobacteria bacterium]|nr:4'-phosphopantetheinyl transferase superfamily protein [Acidobacteriota bacterium]
MPVALDCSDVHIWYRATESLDDRAVNAAVSVLAADERERYGRFLFARDRRDFAAAHALTRGVLSLYEDVQAVAWTFQTTPHGKPFLPPSRAGSPPLAFNLSHTHGLVACAVARGVDVGLDVESTDRVVGERAIARQYFTTEEEALIAACAERDRQTRFTELWTLKEAYIKAVGQGLAHPLDAFGFAFEGAGDLVFDPPPGESADEWTFALFAPAPRARMAVAIRGGRSVRCRIIARADGETRPLEALRYAEPAR